MEGEEQMALKGQICYSILSVGLDIERHGLLKVLLKAFSVVFVPVGSK